MPINTESHQAKAVGKNLRVSWKHCTEIGRWIKGDSLEKAVNKLEQVQEKNLAVPATKFDSDAGHVSGQGKGRYPQNAAEEVLKLLNLAEANAENEGLNTAALEVQKVVTNKGPKIRTPKRHRGQSIKSAHVKIVVGER
ncbi:50S ribosomal protein L22 [Candidatus Nanohalococcus occultus]|uniref:50S ribosomal protein L22 n=1 Tax=Candidatus Nanohalococcus occultus TaxID=2978047 RepID=UPI0039DFBD94